MIQTHKIGNLTFEGDMMFLTLDGNIVEIDLEKVSSKLKSATDIQRSIYKVSPSGYGIHWPLIDEDLAISPLLKSLK
jgi:hypothetical protein